MVSRCAFAVVLACAFVVLAKAQKADALDFYVDGSCSVDGNGAADQCASSAGGAGAFRDPQGCFSAARAGDTCYIKNGTYTSTNRAGDPSETGGFALSNSGTAGNPITIKNYPGHSPLLQNCASGASYSQCANPTISAFQRSYYVIEGLRIRGGLWLYGPGISNHARGVVIRNNDISQGWGEIDDGNWAGIFMQDQTGALIAGNTIHDVSVLSGGGQQSSGSCIKLYQNTDSVVEYNTCRRTRIAESQAGGIDDKAEAVRNIHRFNWIEETPMCVRVNNQLNSTGVQIYGNVCIGSNLSTGTNTCMRLITLINGIDIYNNTCYNYGIGLEIMNEGGTVTNVRAYNNIFANISDNNIEAYQDPTLLDFNAYWPNASAPRYRLGGAWRNALADVIAATNFDDRSREANCGFIAAGSDFRLSSSTCVGQGRRGGTSSGAVVDLGAYGVATCVGATCVNGGGQVPSSGAPPSPQNLRILSSELRNLLPEGLAPPVPVIDKPRAQLHDLVRQPIAVG